MSEVSNQGAFFTTPLIFESLYNIQNFMQFNLFSLTKNKRTDPIIHKSDVPRERAMIEVEADPSYGLATIWDADLLIYLISHVREQIKSGQEPSPNITFTINKFLNFTKRDGGGQAYERFHQSLERLHTTRVNTAISRNGNIYPPFYFLERVRYEKTAKNSSTISIKLADWIYDAAIDDSKVVKLNDQYFGMTGGYERFLYMLARQHEGSSSFTFKELYERSASNASPLVFCKKLKASICKIAQNNKSEYKMLMCINKKKGEQKVKFIYIATNKEVCA